MQIIGEKINGTRKRVGQAIVEHDVAFIQDLARRQADVGVTWLDVNAGTAPGREADDLVWLVHIIQDAVSTPLCLDSADPAALEAVLPLLKQTPMINSISGERIRLEGILPLAVKYGSPVIALAMDEKGIPKTVKDRLTVIRGIVSETRRQGLPDGLLYVDPLAMAISTNTESAKIALDAIRAVRAEFPGVHVTCGLSNISYGLPARSLINRVFVTLALEAGLDSALLDPLDREMRAVLITTDLVLGRDQHCLGYSRAYRAGLVEGGALGKEKHGD